MQVFQTNVSMSWIIGLAVVLIALVVLVLFAVAMPKFKSLQKLVDKVNLVMREILTGLPVIRAFSTEKHEEKRFDKANMDLMKTNLFVNRAMTFMMPIMMLIMNGISVLDHVVRCKRNQRRTDAGRRYDGVYPVYDADYYGIPYDMHVVGYASKSGCCGRSCG